MASSASSYEMERDLVKSSAGFQSKEEYKRKREELEHEKALAALKRQVNGPRAATATVESSQVATAESSQAMDGAKKKKQKKKAAAISALSFGDDIEAEGEASPSVSGMNFSALREQEKQQAAKQQEAAMREVLQQQQRAKEQVLTLRYTFRSEVTQREVPCGFVDGSVAVKRGSTAEEVAVAVRSDVMQHGGPKFAPVTVGGVREERDVLLCCCCAGMPQGTFTVPGAVSLVELSTRKWSDSQLPLFDDFSHGIVVTERRYFEQRKHTVPFSYWRPYDSAGTYAWADYVATRGQPVNVLEPQRPHKK